MADATVSDRLVVEIGADLSGLSQSLAQAGRDVNAFAGGTMATAARDMSGAFDASARSLENSLARAARSGKLSISSMVDAIVSDLARIAIQKFVIAPIEKAASGLGESIGDVFSGLAVGGPVAPGSAYLVGEHGPELFVPSGNGVIEPNVPRAARPQIVMNVTARDAQSFVKSESQVAAMLTRALLRGQKNL